MFSSKSNKPHSRFDSLIGPETVIEGNISFCGGLRIDGRVKGKVIGTGDKPTTLALSEKGMIDGGVTVTHLVVNGTIHGPVHADHLVELQPKARVTGDVHYHTLEMHSGAVVEGRMVHKDEHATSKAGKAITPLKKADIAPASTRGTHAD